VNQPLRVGFSLSSDRTDVDLRLFHGKTLRVASTSPGLATESFAQTLRAGHYTLLVSKHAAADGYYELHVDTSVVASPTRVEAEALGGTAVRVNWLDHSNNETGFAVQQWRKHKWHTIVRTDADATAAVIHNQPVGADMTFRVRSEAVGGTGISPDAAVVQTESVDTSGWFKVSNLSAMIQGEARWVPDGGTLSVKSDDQDKWIQAASWQDAVYSAIEGTANFKKTNGDPVSHTFPGEGDFKVGYAGIMHDDFPDDDGKTGDPPGTFRPIQIDGNNLPTDDQLKVIALEDSYGEVDEDYDDFYWTVDVQEKADLQIENLPEETDPTPNEEDPGADIAINYDNDDESSGDDQADMDQTGTVVGEDDLVAMNIYLPPSMRGDDATGTVELSITAGTEDVAVWLNADKSDGSPLMDSSTTSKTWDVGDQPDIVYVEGLAKGQATLELEATPGAQPGVAGVTPAATTAPAKDKVNVNVGPYVLDVAKINHNASNGVLDQKVKAAKGAFLPVNNDDDDYSASGMGKGEDMNQPVGTAVDGEDDLLPVIIRGGGRAGNLTLNGSGVQVYDNPDRTNPVQLNVPFPAPAQDRTVYVEATASGAGKLMIKLRRARQT
jgi:hypothetical protein